MKLPFAVLGWTFALIIDAVAQTPSRGPQFSDELGRALKDAGQTVVQLTLDRATYLPAETCSLTLTISNPTPNVLQIPDPLNYRGASFDLWSKEPRWKTVWGSEWGSMSPNPNASRDPQPPIVAVPAGDKITKTFGSADRSAMDSFRMEAVPSYSGQFRLVFNYPKAPYVEFRVVPATLEAKFQVSLQGTVSWKIPGILLPGMNPIKTARRTTNIAALAGDGGYWIVATKNLSTGGLRIEPGMEFTPDTAGDLRPLVRVAQSANPVVSVSGVADANDNITITWTDSTGKTSSVRVDKDRKIIPAGQ